MIITHFTSSDDVVSAAKKMRPASKAQGFIVPQNNSTPEGNFIYGLFSDTGVIKLGDRETKSLAEEAMEIFSTEAESHGTDLEEGEE